MVKARARGRRKTLGGVVGLTGSRRVMTVGRELSVPAADQALWLECLMAGVTGVLMAQRRLPNPRMTARVAARIADCVVHEARSRGVEK